MNGNIVGVFNEKQETDANYSVVIAQPCMGEMKRSGLRGARLTCAQRDACINRMHYIFRTSNFVVADQLNPAIIKYAAEENESCKFKSEAAVGGHEHVNAHDYPLGSISLLIILLTLKNVFFKAREMFVNKYFVRSSIKIICAKLTK
jgi:hypothetical protein